MASSKVITTNPDLPRQSSICSLSTILADLQQQQQSSLSSKSLITSMSMDDLLKTFSHRLNKLAKCPTVNSRKGIRRSHAKEASRCPWISGKRPSMRSGRRSFPEPLKIIIKGQPPTTLVALLASYLLYLRRPKG